MATPEPLISRPTISIGRPRRSQASAWWIGASVFGGTVGALAAGALRALTSSLDLGSGELGSSAFAATVVSALIAASAQWFVLNRQRLDAYWWVPATIAANLLSAIMIIPSVVHLFASTGPSGTPQASLATTILTGTAALAASGLVLGAAQAVVLRRTSSNLAWLWVPATLVGGALSGAITTALASQVFGLPGFGAIALVAATGSLLTAASQAPVLARVVRPPA